jgi:hypothetical protein
MPDHAVLYLGVRHLQSQCAAVRFPVFRDDPSSVSRLPPALREEDGKLRFREQETAPHEILAFLAENRIAVAQLQQAEQSLESLFLEVAE